MSNDELKEYMRERLDMQDKLIKDISRKLDPVITEQERMKGALGAIKWLIGVGFTSIGIIIALLELKFR